MWALVALHNSGPNNKALRQATTAATKWLGEKTKGVSTEWWSTQLLLKRALKNDEAADQANSGHSDPGQN